MSETPIWSKTTAENIIRHRSGTYYLSAMVAGKKVRKSLKTSKLPVAKIKRDGELEKLRSAVKRPVSEIATVGDALALVQQRIEADPDLKPATRVYYEKLFGYLLETLPLSRPGGEWTADEGRTWWQNFAKTYSTNRVNNCLRLVKKVGDVLVEHELRRDNPIAGLNRMKGEKRMVEGMPSVAEMDAVIQSIRDEKKRFSEESANFVEFLAWSGLRISEARAVEWEHVLADWLVVMAGKNREQRRVPMNKRLRALLTGLRKEDSAGPVFAMVSPRAALDNAAERLGLKHLRIHDLRHWFATHAIESGVDVPTVSRWLGHKDGGALAMRVYGHLRDDHSLAAAKRMG